MAVIIATQNQNRASTPPISEQNKLLSWLIGEINTSQIFKNYEVNFNDLKSDKSNVGIVQLSGATKSRQDVCGGYDAVIPFSIIFRTLGTVTDDERLTHMDLVNQLGAWLEENCVRNKSVTGYTIYSVLQRTQTVVSYRDDSGIEDVSADFEINYSKD